MIIVRLMGGLGNQMFQYAFGRAMSLKMKNKLAFDISLLEKGKERSDFTYRKLGLNKFKIDLEIIEHETVDRILKLELSFRDKLRRKILNFTGTKHSMKNLIVEESLKYSKDYTFIPQNCVLQGYWQSENYFLKDQKTIRNDFSLQHILENFDKNIIHQIQESCSVGIHIRRGDYIFNPDFNKIYDVCDYTYYQKAIKKIQSLLESPKFFVFSDEIEWVNKNMKFPQGTVFVSKPDNLPIEDLALFSICKHAILANSTFSWWGAWLNENSEKKIIAPQVWTKSSTMNDIEIVPKRWITI